MPFLLDFFLEMVWSQINTLKYIKTKWKRKLIIYIFSLLYNNSLVAPADGYEFSEPNAFRKTTLFFFLSPGNELLCLKINHVEINASFLKLGLKLFSFNILV